ncbi:hypothetical protein MRX96_035803, partial [Rhipicephalus microplus]
MVLRSKKTARIASEVTSSPPVWNATRRDSDAERYSTTRRSCEPTAGDATPNFLRESKYPAFFGRIVTFWNDNITHFGLLNIYREYTDAAVMTQVFNVLKALYLYLKPRFTSTRTLFYVVGMSLDDPAGYPVLKLMKTVFTPSMFVAIAHLSYPVRKFKDCRIFPVVVDSLPTNLTRGKDYTYGHTFNETMAVVQEVYNLNLSIPLAISFSYKGIYYVPPKLCNTDGQHLLRVFHALHRPPAAVLCRSKG